MSKNKWTESSARDFLSKNGHGVGAKAVSLRPSAGIRAFGCADYLKKVYSYTVTYSKDKE